MPNHSADYKSPPNSSTHAAQNKLSALPYQFCGSKDEGDGYGRAMTMVVEYSLDKVPPHMPNIPSRSPARQPLVKCFRTKTSKIVCDPASTPATNAYTTKVYFCISNKIRRLLHPRRILKRMIQTSPLNMLLLRPKIILRFLGATTRRYYFVCSTFI